MTLDDDPTPGRPHEGECDDTPKLTAEEWAYVQAVAEAAQGKDGES